jgi:3-hydroxybutyryl-CoA dehydrogenase
MSDLEITKTIVAPTARRVAVIGSGTMGHGIALVAARAGLQAVLCDVSQELLNAAVRKVGDFLQKGVERGKTAPEEKEQILARLTTAVSLEEAAREADLVIEAAPEKMSLKRELFSTLGRVAPPAAILATNTSSLSVTEIAQSSGRPERVLGMHFFNPPPIMKLLEIVRGERTAPEVVESAKRLASAFGKEAIVVGDTPGFATSRLGVVVGFEAIRMVEQGVGAPEDIDKAMTLGYGHPMGPLRLGDLVGLDVRLAIGEYLYAELGGDQYRPPQLLRRMVRAGKLGQKSGEGFYRW